MKLHHARKTSRMKLQMSMGMINNLVAGFIPARKGLNIE